MKQAIKTILSGLALAWFGLVVLNSTHPLNGRLNDWAFDWAYSLGTWAHQNLDESPVTIVYLDTESYLSQQQDPNLPFSRALHAKALDRLTLLGVKAVIYDIIFGGPSSTGEAEDDKVFENAIRRNKHVILGADLIESSFSPGTEESIRTQRLELPYTPLLSAAAGWGMVQHQIDSDFVVRHFFPGFLHNDQPSLAVTSAQMLGHEPLDLNKTQRLYYYGRPFTIPQVSLRSILEEDGVDPSKFLGKIVLIGARPATGGFDERRDEVRSPFSSWGTHDRLFMPGVEVHATQLINLINNDRIQVPTMAQSSILLLVSGLLFSVAAFLFSIRRMLAFSVAAFFILGALGIAAFHQVKFQAPWTHATLLQLPIALAANFAGRSSQWYRQRLSFLRAKKLADQKIKEQAVLLNRAHDAIVVLLPSGKRMYENQSALRLFNATPFDAKDLSGLALWEQIPDELLQEAMQQTLSTGVWEGEFTIARNEASPRRIESRWTQIRDASGQVQSIMTLSTDVTEKRQLEQQLLQTQRMETIGSLAGGVAHDLNNALSPILMGVQLMRRQSSSEKATRMLDVMEASTQRGAEMVRQILAFTRGSGEDRQWVDLRSLIEDLEHLVKETFPKNIEISSYLASDLRPLQANPTQIHQILLNLCVNARDAMPDGGHLTIAVDKHQQTEAESLTFGNRTPGDYLLLMLSDTGSGISAEKISQIFEPFYSTKAQGKGTGLGLTTVKSIVDKHGGCIEVSSELGSGTTFEIYLPTTSQPEPSSLTETPVPPPTGQGEHILIVDDEQAVREMIASTLEASGYVIHLAGNGPEALSLLSNQSFHLVILDNDMPMMPGRQCLNEIRQLDETLPVLLISGEIDSQADSDECSLPHCVELAKPFRIESLLQQVGHLIRNNH